MHAYQNQTFVYMHDHSRTAPSRHALVMPFMNPPCVKLLRTCTSIKNNCAAQLQRKREHNTSTLWRCINSRSGASHMPTPRAAPWSHGQKLSHQRIYSIYTMHAVYKKQKKQLILPLHEACILPPSPWLVLFLYAVFHVHKQHAGTHDWMTIYRHLTRAKFTCMHACTHLRHHISVLINYSHTYKGRIRRQEFMAHAFARRLLNIPHLRSWKIRPKSCTFKILKNKSF